MGLFNFSKKKTSEPVTQEAKPCGCGKTENCNDQPQASSVSTKEGITSVKILGGGCKKCNELEAATAKALATLGIDIKIEHVTDFSVIATYGVMSTPAIVVNEKVISYGKVLKPEEVVALVISV